MDRASHIINEIVNTRKEMEQTATTKGFSANETVIISQKLDKLLNEYERLQTNQKAGSSLKELEAINKVIHEEASILLTDASGIILFVNDRCCEMVGYQKQELIGKHTRMFNCNYHTKDYFATMWQTILTGHVWKNEIAMRHKNGNIVWMLMTIFPILDSQNKPYQFLTLRTNITENKEMERQAARKESQLSSLIKNSVDMMGIINDEGLIIYQNHSIETILGFKAEEVIGTRLVNYFEKKLNDTPSLNSFGNDYTHFPVKVKHKNGIWKWCEIRTSNHLNDPYIKGIIYNIRDITEQEKVKEKIQHLTQYDHLTGLNNRRSFKEHLSQTIKAAKTNKLSFSLILIDIDGFKYVNDSFGYEIGDKLLQKVAVRIRSAFQQDVFSARLGGDEFVLLFPTVNNNKEIHKIGSQLIKLFDDYPFQIEGYEFFMTASIGISVFPTSSKDGQKLLKHAGTALTRAKHEGKNNYQLYSPKMNTNSIKRFTLKNDLKRAISNDEFLIYYQPRVNPLNGHITGGEALIRWKHPDFGIISPKEFISLAEESGLIIKIGLWTIRKVCKQIKTWQLKGLKFSKISINISPIQLYQSDFVKNVCQIITDESVMHSHIELEVTESVVIDNDGQALRALKQLQSFGISIALDDFGTGYSSLNYLRKLPCQVVKIDKSFVYDIETNRESYDIFHATILLCQKLKKSIVVEGIETKKQLELITKLKCNEFQGYLCSKPVPEAEFILFLENKKWCKHEECSLKKAFLQEASN